MGFVKKNCSVAQSSFFAIKKVLYEKTKHPKVQTVEGQSDEIRFLLHISVNVLAVLSSFYDLR